MDEKKQPRYSEDCIPCIVEGKEMKNCIDFKLKSKTKKRGKIDMCKGCRGQGEMYDLAKENARIVWKESKGTINQKVERYVGTDRTEKLD